MRWMCLFGLVATPVVADPAAVHAQAQRMYDNLPRLVELRSFDGECGAGRQTNPNAFYCTTENTIYVTGDRNQPFADRSGAAYEVAHLLGHATQVKHGVADVALREISSRRDEEAMLRGYVERQVNCLAGVFMARAELPAIDLASTFGGEPFTDAHWGRRPVDAGPQVSIGLEAAQDWLDRGYRAGDVAVCSVGEFSSDLLVSAQR